MKCLAYCLEKRRFIAPGPRRGPAVAAVVSAILASTSYAQTPATTTTAEPASSGGLEEIVVTAQKRTEKLQDVPISIAVVNPQKLAATDMNETGDLQYLVPDVQINQINGPRAFGVFIRGLGTTSFSTQSIESSVAYVVDGVVYGQAGAAVQDFGDVERVEVLRGPQGTLFGKNASAGVINVVTRRPSSTFGVDASVSYADPFNERKASAVITGPITDTLRYLVSARLNQHDGYIDNVADGRTFNNRNDYGARVRLEWDPNDTLQVTTIGDWFQRHAHCCLPTLRRAAPTPSLTEQLSLAAGIVPGPDNLKQNIDGDALNYEDNYGGSVQADYQLPGGYTLTSITAYRRWYTLDGLDTDNSPLNLLDINYADYWQHQTTEELRVASPLGPRVDFVAGLFFFKQGVHYHGRQRYPTIPVPFLGFDNFVDATTRNMAVFGQANVHLTDAFTLILGARQLQERGTANKLRTDPVTTASQYTEAAKTANGTVWRAGLKYQLNEHDNVFATVTRGYKAGGFDTNPTIVGLPDVGPEIPTNYEIGARTYWPQQRLTANATLFWTTVRDYQVSALAVNPITSTTGFFIVNAARARSRGVELETQWRPLAETDLEIGANAAYLDARWQSYRNSPCFGGQTAAQGCINSVQDLSGTQLARSPHYQLNLDTSYSRELPGGHLRATFFGNLDYQSRTHLGYDFPDFQQGSRALVNTSISLGDSSDRWKASLFVRNLTDKNYVITIPQTTFGVAPYSLSQYPLYEARRIVGASFEVHF